MPELSLLSKLRILWRALFLQAAWNAERMQGMGFCFSVIPLAKKIFETTETRNRFVQQNLEFFNTHPYMSTWIIGAYINITRESLLSREQAGLPSKFKKRMSESLAAVGDQIFWHLLRPISAMLGIVLALYSGLLGVCFFLVIYNLPQVYVRIRGLHEGYTEGFQITKTLNPARFKPLLENLSKLGGFVLGALILLTVNSKLVSGPTEMIALGLGFALMYVLMRRKTPVPIALMPLMACVAIAAAILYSIGNSGSF